MNVIILTDITLSGLLKCYAFMKAEWSLLIGYWLTGNNVSDGQASKAIFGPTFTNRS
jgi:hypothetical protein